MALRQPGAPVVSLPTVQDVRPDQELTLDLVLPSGQVCGSFDAGAIAPQSHRDIVARLFRAGPVVADRHGRRTAMAWVTCDVGETGRFAFPGLPPGDYVLRVGELSGDSSIVQRHVAVGTGTVDLGQVPPDPTVDVVVTVDLGGRTAPTGFGAWLRQVLPGCPEGAFRAWAWEHQGKVKLPRVPPGRYLIQMYVPSFTSHSFGDTGEPCGEPVPLEIRGDGSTVPERIVVR